MRNIFFSLIILSACDTPISENETESLEFREGNPNWPNDNCEKSGDWKKCTECSSTIRSTWKITTCLTCYYDGNNEQVGCRSTTSSTPWPG